MTRDYRRRFRMERGPREDAADKVDEELELHLELTAEELVAEGWSPADALQEARRRFGDLDDARSYCTRIQKRRGRVETRTRFMDEVRQDLGYALRGLRKAPGYSALVVLTLAFGIASNTTIVSVMTPYLFRSLPYGDANELVHITQVNTVTGWHMDRFSVPIFEDWAGRTRGLEDAALYNYGGVTLTGPEGPEGVNLSRISVNLLETLQVQPAMGRGFLPGEGQPGAAPVVLLDHELWQRRYLGDPDILGRSITLDGVAHTVVGVMPPEFVFPFNRIRLWVPIQESAAADRARAPYLMVGRLGQGWDRERLDSELTTIQAELRTTHPDADARWSGVTVLPMRQALNFAWDIISVSFAVLLGAVLFVLAIACINVASLTLARASTRLREVALRSALGASRSRLVRQLLTESLVLALLGGALGVGTAWMAVQLIGPLLPADLYRVGEASLDPMVLGFSAMVTLVTPLLFGLAPALHSTRKGLVQSLKEGSKGSGGRATSLGRRMLVSAQVALAVVLIAGAGLMVRSLQAVQELDLGFQPSGIVQVMVQPPQTEYDGEALRGYLTAAVQELESLPGVTYASAVQFLPLNNESIVWQVSSPEQAGRPAEEWPTAIANRSWPGYLRTMGVPLLEGRDFTARDDMDADPVVMVNQVMAQRFWPQGEAVGRTLLMGDPSDPVEARVVGVVGGVRHEDLAGGNPGPQLYRPLLQAVPRRSFLLARVEGDPASVIPGARRALQSLDPDIPLPVGTMDAVVDQSRLQWSIGSSFLGVFGLGALLVAALGIYGLIAFSVSQRRRELGVRAALGASRGELRWAVLLDGLRTTGGGLVAGLVGALLLGRLLEAVLYGVTPYDPLTLGGVLVLFLVVSAAASLVPAGRAARANPVEALRAE